MLAVKNYEAYSMINWVQIGGMIVFLIASNIALKQNRPNRIFHKTIAILFILFILIVSYSVSYTISLQNTKNTLTLFLIGIAIVSLFFAIEFIEIILITLAIIAVYWMTMLQSKIDFEEKMMNFFAGAVLGFILFCFSRYSYYFKSQHFVRLKQLEEKNAEIEKLHTQQGEILGFVAHDLRNPLNNIEALSSLLLLEESKEELNLILSSSVQAKSIINDLIEVIKTDRSQLETTSANLSQFVSTVVDKWRKNTNRNFELLQDEHEIIAYANLSKLERVLDNLISNAIKFSSDDKPVKISLKKLAKKIEISVIDQGIGIPPELLAYVFQQFSKAGRNGLHGEKSIGLGLHISRKIVQQHGGELEVESQEDKGSTFKIIIPLVKF